MTRHGNILGTIGHTPLVKVNSLPALGVNVYLKLEAFNPMGSVKDRMARAIIEHAEDVGDLLPGQTVVEATSGNTGIGLAMVCATKGYPLVVTMAENFSVERRKLLRFLGARVVLTPAADKGTGMLAKAEELARTHGYFLCHQFDNPVNAQVHTETTAAEIIADFHGEQLHYFVSGFGTGGTLCGVARGLKSADPNIQIVAAEPDNAPLLGSGIPQPRNADGGVASSHPHFRPHLMQGWSPDFVSRLTERAVAEGLVDEIVAVSGEQALATTRELALKEGILAGTSSGATLAAALQVAKCSPAGTNIVCMAPDTGERYLSTPLFEHIASDMNKAEKLLSSSTPGYRFDAPAPKVEPVEKATPESVNVNASRFVESTVNENRIVVFALQWCEFCWSARKLLERMSLEYLSVDLDDVVYQQNDFGGQIRQVLADRCDAVTIPQIFVNGEHIGGCTELFDAYINGSLHDLLQVTKVGSDEGFDPYSLLPRWLEPRQSAGQGG